MSVIPKSGCLTVKQITKLNDEFTGLPFELGTVLDCAFEKILNAEFQVCDGSEIPQDTGGEQQFLCVVDGICTFVDKSEVVTSNETITTFEYDSTTHTVKYTNEDGTVVEETLNCGSLDFDPDTCEVVYVDEKGVETRKAITNIATGFDDTTVPTTDFVNYLGHDSDGKVVAVPLPDQIDVKCVTLCDVGNDNKPYILEVTNNLTQGTKTTATYEIDGVTAYTAVEAGVYKPDDIEIQTVYMFKKDSIPNGINENYWEIGPDATGTNGNGIVDSQAFTPIDQVFTETDECGVLQHPNPTDAVNVLTVAQTTDPTSSQIAHESELDFWIKVPECGAKLSARVNGYSSYAVYFASCASKLNLIEKGENSEFAGTAFYDIPLGSIGTGFFHVRLLAHDPGTRGKTLLEWDLNDGNGLVAIPTENLLSERPSASCVQICYNKTTGEQTFLDGTVVDPNIHEIYPCDPCNVPTGLPPTVQDVNDQCFITKKWVFDTTSIPAGVTEKFWQLDAGVGFGSPDVGSTQNPAGIPIVFPDSDPCGLPVHVNDSDAIVNIIPVASSTDPGGSISHQNELDFWLCVDQPGISVSARVNGFSSYAVYFGGCSEKLSKVAEGVNTTASGTNFFDIPLGVLPTGFFHVRFYVSDPSQFGKTLLQWDVGNGLEDIPTENLISAKPSAVCVDLIYNKTQKKYQNLDGTDFDTEVNKCFSCDPCTADAGLQQAIENKLEVEQQILCDQNATGEVTQFVRHTIYNSDGSVSDCYDTTLDSKTAYEVAGQVSSVVKDDDCEVIAVWNETYAVPTTGPIGIVKPSNATYFTYLTCAKIQATGGDVRFTVNEGGVPDFNDLAGCLLKDCGVVNIGCCGTGVGSLGELDEFQVVASDPDTFITVTWYGQLQN